MPETERPALKARRRASAVAVLGPDGVPVEAAQSASAAIDDVSTGDASGDEAAGAAASGAAASGAGPDSQSADPASAEDDAGSAAEEAAPAADEDNAKSFHRRLERRLRRWHRRIAEDARIFDELDEESVHSLRKRIKRQRYAVEFFTPVLGRRKSERYLEPLSAIQDRMGELNDLFVARARYEEIVATDPAAWFALGWLAARIAEVRALAGPELIRLAKAEPPTG